jgi:hypothetical protein
VAALVAVDVRDRRRHAVHDRAKLRLARRQRILRELEVGDVVARDVLALDRAVEIEVGTQRARIQRVRPCASMTSRS